MLWITAILSAMQLLGGPGAADESSRPTPMGAVGYTSQHVNRNIPGPGSAREVEDQETTLSASERANALPAPEPDHHAAIAAPLGFVSQAVSYDPASGIETLHDLDTTSALRAAWTEGRASPDAVNEPGAAGRSWTGDLFLAGSQAFPWSTQCKVYYQSGGFTYQASGTLIDGKYVITAGFVVHGGPGKTWNTGITVSPAWDGDNDQFGTSGYSSVATFTGWINTGSLDDCIGIIRLSRPVGHLTGWLGTTYSTLDSFYTSTTFNLAGYPATCYPGAPHELYYGFGSYDSATSTLLSADSYWSCPSSGMGGAGSYWLTSGNRYVVAVHSGICTLCSPDRIYHTRLTQGKFDYLHNTFIPAGYSTTQPDYVALDVNVPAGTYTAGDPIAGMNYLVANSSLYNPVGTQTYSVDVYLSTNSTISTFDTLIQSHTFSRNFGPRDEVRNTVLNRPVIPANTPSGSYWIGVIVNVSDADNNNNDSSGWDAAPIDIEGCNVQMNSFGVGLAGSGGFVPALFGSATGCQSGAYSITISNALGGMPGHLWVGVGQDDIFPFYGGHFYLDLSQVAFPIPIRLQGALGQPGGGFAFYPSQIKAQQGTTAYIQVAVFDPGAPRGLSLSNGLEMVVDY